LTPRQRKRLDPFPNSPRAQVPPENEAALSALPPDVFRSPVACGTIPIPRPGACSFELVYERLQPRQLREQIREQVFSAPASINELYAGFRVAVNSPHFTDRPE